MSEAPREATIDTVKIAVISESLADETALITLIPALLSLPVKFIAPGLRARGWPSVAQILPSVIRHLHFSTDADALAVVVDADDSPIHDDSHERPGYFHPQCRMCQLRAVFRQTTKNLPPANGRKRVLRAVGVAVPAIEAWYLCGKDDQVSEKAWCDGREKGALPYTRRELKERVYGTPRPSLALETEHALAAMQRHTSDTRRLEYDFPGFGWLAADLRALAEMKGSNA